MNSPIKPTQLLGATQKPATWAGSAVFKSTTKTAKAVVRSGAGSAASTSLTRVTGKARGSRRMSRGL